MMDMGGLANVIERHWKYRNQFLAVLLWPLARIFQSIAALRRFFYQHGWLNAASLPCPVVIIGNIHVGGVGKTPLVAAIVRALQKNDIKVGIISRGYGRASKDTLVIDEDTLVTASGDEPLMLYRQLKVPVAVGTTRLAAGEALFRLHPDLQVLISDDGLQHYALKRDLEIVVFPARDIGKSLDLLPNGPLREPLARINDADGILFSQGNADDLHNPAIRHWLANKWCGYSRLHYGSLYRFNQPAKTAISEDFIGQRCAAIAAIGRPERFFQALENLDIVLSEKIALPDHAPISASDWPDADVIFITEKDAIKLSQPQSRELWVLPLEAEIIPDVAAWIQERLHLK